MILKDILSGMVGLEAKGDKNQKITAVLSLQAAAKSTNYLTWCADRNLDALKTLKNGTAIVSKEALNLSLDPTLTLVVAENPRRAFQMILATHFLPPQPRGISKTAIIATSAKIGKNVFIGNNVNIGENCVIGDNTIIQHNTVLFDGTQVADNVVIGANCTIGGVGFGYVKDDDGDYEGVPHISHVVISEDVEIGNNTCIDRGVLEPTFIGRNVKIDNLVHIAHNVQVGENSMIIANAMIAGSVTLGKNSWVAPSASIRNRLKLGEESFVGFGAVVVKNVDAGVTVVGNPAKPLIKK